MEFVVIVASIGVAVVSAAVCYAVVVGVVGVVGYALVAANKAAYWVAGTGRAPKFIIRYVLSDVKWEIEREQKRLTAITVILHPLNK
jgi:hypothetical protein